MSGQPSVSPVALVVVSRDRPAFLERLFRYLGDESFPGAVHLGDASTAALRPDVDVVAHRHQARIDLRYSRYPESSPVISRLRSEAHKVEAEVCAWVGDDDFIVPAAIVQAVCAFKSAPGASTMVGAARLVEVEDGGVHGTVRGIAPYPQYGFDAATAIERLDQFCSTPCALTYSIRRTVLWRQMLDDIDALKLPANGVGYLLFELLDAFLTVASGTVEKRETLCLVRQTHSSSAGATGGLATNFLPFLESAAWPPLRSRVTGCIVTALLRHDSAISIDDAEAAANSAIERSVVATLTRLTGTRSGIQASNFRRIKTIIKHVFPRLSLGLSRMRALGTLNAPDAAALRRIVALIENP